jgi:hypothetical protein
MDKPISRALEIIKEYPTGVHYLELSKRIQEDFPGVDMKTIAKALRKHPDVYQPGREMFGYIKFKKKFVQKSSLTLYLNPKVVQAIRPFFTGLSIKTTGYFMIAGGIFIGFADKEVGLKLVLMGVITVIAGWLLIYRAFKKAAR